MRSHPISANGIRSYGCSKNIGQTVTVSDSRGNVYKRAVQLDVSLDAPDGDTLAIFYATAVTGGANTVTVATSSSASLRFAIAEYAGVATTGTLDVVAAAQGSTASPDSGVATTTSFPGPRSVMV